MIIPERDLARVADAHRRLFEAVGALSDDDIGRPSLLPGWTIGHVLAHLARNADSHVRRAAAARRGEVVDQYPGGYGGRSAEIESGSSRSARELADDVMQSASAAEAAWVDLPGRLWSRRSRDANGKARPLFELPSRRWQEVEVHLVDLDIGITWASWPEDFVLEWLPRTRERVWDRLPPEANNAEFDDPAEELAWLYGRLQRDDLPAPPPWG
ncbi:MAG TPA: maleylpyruvate isomerase N-terminal domain-containing protein [Acidimicrobiales bacterium]|nr:maleylpyruvate isomerase N-terminal domain-containing protein [Acidimicrobiales bacterium]